MCYPYFHRENSIVGPATHKFYDHKLTITNPSMVCERGLRSKLSSAVSYLYFLKPHALILSQIESKPLTDYFDPQAYHQAQLLYFGGSTPGKDLLECLTSIRNLRI